jgi:RNA polymerase sigma-70 factor (ECF subfamily)
MLPAGIVRIALVMANEPDSAAQVQAGPPASTDEQTLVVGLRAGDEASFILLVERYHAALLRLALQYVSDRSAAEEVVQETWLGLLRGIDGFEGRSSLRTWLFRILTNRAKRRGQRESRTLPFSAVASNELNVEEPAVDPERFRPPGHQWAGHWVTHPPSWEGEPERRLLANETRQCIREAIAELPPAQQQVIVLRDVEGWTAAEVCTMLDLTETNQRVLLHRSRSKVRRSLERYLGEDARTQ